MKFYPFPISVVDPARLVRIFLPGPLPGSAFFTRCEFGFAA